MSLIIGIDWFVEPKNRALVTLNIRERSDRIEVMDVLPRVADQLAVAYCKDKKNAVVAVDIPFGWPSAFGAFVSSWSPRRNGCEVPATETFRFRRTDQIVRNDVCGCRPWSVSAERFAMGARSWAELLARNCFQQQVDVIGGRGGTTPKIIEVYPGATAKAFDQRIHSYKRDPNVRHDLVKHVGKMFDVSFGSRLSEIVGTDTRSDETDAFLAAMTAAIYLKGINGNAGLKGWTIRCPTLEEQQDAEREGWIFFPERRG